uniref:C-factor n=1 Tax=Arion vulgaris TaxID=1028688 RepID=A0A0B6Z2N3_9EUPU
MALTARTILVTGASRGLGLEFVKQILKLPTAPEVLIAACRDPATATKLQAIAQNSPSVKIIKLDVEKDEDLETALQETRNAVGNRGLNLIINNAGIYLNKADGGGIAKQTRERLQKHFDVNVSGPIILVQKFLPLLQQAAAHDKSKTLSCSKAGVVFISSTMGSQTITFTHGAGTSLDYKCSKSAVTMASILLARELKDSGIYVAALHPGWVKTEMGGDGADITSEQSIQGCLSVISSVREESSGKLLDYKGAILPY